jgi:hypothetical protein
MPAIAAALDGVGLYALSFGGMLATSVLGMVLAGASCDRHGALRARFPKTQVYFGRRYPRPQRRFVQHQVFPVRPA